MRGRTGSEQMLKPAFPTMRAKAIACAAAAILLLAGAWPAAAEPIKIGFGMALTGGRARNGNAAALPIPIWGEEGNAKGRALGRAGPPGSYGHPDQPGPPPR